MFIVSSNEKQVNNENAINAVNNIKNSNTSLNESVNDLIEVLKLNDNKSTINNNKPSQQNQLNSLPQANNNTSAIKISPLQPKPPMTEKSNNSNVYSFSSRPKVVDPVDTRKNNSICGWMFLVHGWCV